MGILQLSSGGAGATPASEAVPADSAAGAPPPLQLSWVLKAVHGDPHFASQEFDAAAAAATIQLIARAAAAAADSPAFPEMFCPAANALEALAIVPNLHRVGRYTMLT